METIIQDILDGLVGLSPAGLGFGLGFAMWVAGSAVSAIFAAFDAGAGLESID